MDSDRALAVRKRGCREVEFHGIKLIHIDLLGLSQIYLSSRKIASVTEWFNPQNMDHFQPLAVHDFGNKTYTLVDGHTRAYVAYKNGISILPVFYDNDDIVTNRIGKMLYKADLDWCKRFKLSHIKQLENRILDQKAYQKLWIERCDRSYDLITQTSHEERLQLQNLVPDLFLYGASEDLSVLFFENEAGNLFLYKDNILTPEKWIIYKPETT